MDPGHSFPRLPGRRDPPARPRIGLSLPKSRRSPAGALLALAFHVALLVLIVRVVPALDFEPAAGPTGIGSGGGGGGGGRAVRMVLLAAAEPPPPPPVVKVPPPPPPPVLAPPIEQPDLVVAPPVMDSLPVARSDSGTGTGAGAGEGSGKGSGSGSGSGTGTGSGTGSGRGAGAGPGDGGGGRARAPEPRQLILPPPEVPKSLRGVTIAVTFMVDPTGRVVDVRLDPEPADRGFAKKLEEVMRNYRFRPARSEAGLPIAGVTTVSLSF